MKILLVEDDLELAETVVAWFTTMEPYEVEMVDNGKEAQEKLALQEYDVVILDWDLPGTTGIELCKQFRASGGTAPVLMTTGRKMITDKEEGFDSGADDYITKPYDLQELSMRIKALLRRVAQRPQPQKVLDAGSLVGTVLADRYQVVSELGQGGMGAVYMAKHTALGRNYALKVLHAQQMMEPNNCKRFEREARAASALAHPNLISVYDFGFTSFGQPFLVMDYLEGRGLDQEITQRGPLEPVRFIKIFSQICDGLAHAHGKGIIHRDLKPSNIMLLSKDGDPDFVKVVDFGIAKIVSQTETIQQLTQTGEFFGSPLYVSPEQCQNLEMDSRSDIYSLGCVMYEAVTGVRPLVGDGVLQTVLKHLSEKPKPLAEVRPDLNLPARLEQVIFKALEKLPEHRQQSMSELKAEVDKLG